MVWWSGFPNSIHAVDGCEIHFALEMPTNNGFPWFQSGAGFRPSTGWVDLSHHLGEVFNSPENGNGLCCWRPFKHTKGKPESDWLPIQHQVNGCLPPIGGPQTWWCSLSSPEKKYNRSPQQLHLSPPKKNDKRTHSKPEKNNF